MTQKYKLPKADKFIKENSCSAYVKQRKLNRELRPLDENQKIAIRICHASECLIEKALNLLPDLEAARDAVMNTRIQSL